MCIMLIATSLTGCGNLSSTETMTAKEFKNQMEGKGFTVEDKTDSAKDTNYQKIYVAADVEKYSFEYYFMKRDDSADMVYQYAVSNLNRTYEGKDTATIVEKEKNGMAYYSVSAEDYYCEVIKKENTVLYVTAHHDFKEEAKKIISELGY